MTVSFDLIIITYFKITLAGDKSGIFLKIVQAPAKQTKFMLFNSFFAFKNTAQ